MGSLRRVRRRRSRHLQAPASEAGMIVETGHYALVLALALAAVQALLRCGAA